MNHTRTEKTGLFFGSFDPIHTGHLIIAQYFAEYSDLEKIWFVVSPQNPFKRNHDLLPGAQRLEMVELAIDGNPYFMSCDVELTLGTPSYTINTLRKLKENYPGKTFVLIMGSDNQESLMYWKDIDEILRDFEIYVYPRPGFEPEKSIQHPKIQVYHAPLLEISSTRIREMIASGKKPQYLLPDQVLKKIESSGYYSNP
jgi:nicotinate-nucleotide adenylyltransferase